MRRSLLVALVIALAVGLLLLAALALYVTQSRPDYQAPQVRSAAVRPILAIGGPGRGEHPRFSRPLGAAYGPDGRIYVSDSGNDRICVFDSQGRFVFEFGGPTGRSTDASETSASASASRPGTTQPAARPSTETAQALAFPVGLDVVGALVYVADVREGDVDVFGTDGRYLRRLVPTAEPTTAPVAVDDSPAAPTDVAVQGARVYITDTDSVLALDQAGRIGGRFGYSEDATFALSRPNGVTVSSAGVVYVSDSNGQRVVAFTRSGKRFWSTDQRSSAGPGSRKRSSRSTKLGLPRGLTVAGDGTILVADALEHQIVRLSLAGEVLARYGSLGSAEGQFSFPNDVDERDGLVLVTDKGNNRVQVVRLQSQR